MELKEWYADTELERTESDGTSSSAGVVSPAERCDGVCRMKVESKGIASCPEVERPRELLLRLGPQALTDAELLVNLLQIGFQGTRVRLNGSAIWCGTG